MTFGSLWLPFGRAEVASVAFHDSLLVLHSDLRWSSSQRMAGGCPDNSFTSFQGSSDIEAVYPNQVAFV